MFSHTQLYWTEEREGGNDRGGGREREMIKRERVGESSINIWSSEHHTV